MKRYKKILLTVLSVMSCSFIHAQELYKNENAPVHERVMDLISRLTVEEKISLLRATSPPVFPVWALINTIMGMKRYMELSVPDVLPYFHKPSDWQLPGIRSYRNG